jgi:methionyl-tRNA formyltransferase
MRILFVGGFVRGFELLKLLTQRGEEVVAAYVCAEDPHEEVQVSSAMLSFCAERGIPVTRTRKATNAEAEQVRTEYRPDVVFCLGWRTVLPAWFLRAAPRGVVAAHDSLLPRLRGFAPTNWGLLLGHEQIGVTLFRLTEEIDDGEVYFQESFRVQPEDTLAAIQERVARLSVGLFARYLDAAQAGTLSPQRQEHELATYTCARTPDDGLIDWAQPTQVIARLVRALAPPGPGAYTFYDGDCLRVLEATALANPRRYEGRIPGRIVRRDTALGFVDVLTGDGVVRLGRVQADGAPPRQASEVLTSVRRSVGVNPALEVYHLRQAVRALEKRLARLEAPWAHAQPV